MCSVGWGGWGNCGRLSSVYDVKSVALYSAYVDTPQNTIKSTRIYICLFTMFFVVFMILFDDAKCVAWYSAYVYIPQNISKPTRNYDFFYLFFGTCLCDFFVT